MGEVLDVEDLEIHILLEEPERAFLREAAANGDDDVADLKRHHRFLRAGLVDCDLPREGVHDERHTRFLLDAGLRFPSGPDEHPDPLCRNPCVQHP